MDYRTLETLRQKHPAWRLLTADHAPLVASFLHQTFIRSNIRTIAQSELTARLEDFLYRLRRELGEEHFPKAAEQYLDDWATDDHGWLRKYYPQHSDEAHFDITSATEKAIAWLDGLGERQFIGTESRLLTVFELLRQLVEGTATNPAMRIRELDRRKTEIEAEIKRIREGQLSLMDPTGVKDRFLQMAATARGLLSDFREVEQNFRDLDRAVRERIATWDGSKADLLATVFGERDAIADSDQGRSFRAFWDFLMSPAKQEELSGLLKAVLALDSIQELKPDRRLLRVHHDWLQAGEVTQRTVARLSQELRRYLDDKAWLENRRIMELLKDIEQKALDLRESPAQGLVMEIDETGPDIGLAMDRPLFNPPIKPSVGDWMGTDDLGEIPADALFGHVFVDKAKLQANIRRALQMSRQISLADLVSRYPLERGLAELVAYFSLAADDGAAVIDDTQRQTLAWTDTEGTMRQATMPLVIFTRASVSSESFG